MHSYTDIENGQVFIIVGVSSLTVPEEQDGTSVKKYVHDWKL